MNKKFRSVQAKLSERLGLELSDDETIFLILSHRKQRRNRD